MARGSKNRTRKKRGGRARSSTSHRLRNHVDKMATHSNMVAHDKKNRVRELLGSAKRLLKRAASYVVSKEQPKPDVLDFTMVLNEEFKAIHAKSPGGKDLNSIRAEMASERSAALCLSGGGIRSASYCLGVLRGLSARGCLKRFDYLSTVSGGGYTGSMVNAWAYRASRGVNEVETSLGGAQTRVDAVHKLRRYTSYLSPNKGITSLDTWTLLATYLRNLLLNWLILIPLLGLFVATPFTIAALVDLPHSLLPPGKEFTIICDAAFCLGLVLVFCAIYQLRRSTSLSGRTVLDATIVTPHANFKIVLGMGLGTLLLSLSRYWSLQNHYVGSLDTFDFGGHFFSHNGIVLLPATFCIAFDLISVLFIIRVGINRKNLRPSSLIKFNWHLIWPILVFCLTGVLLGLLVHFWAASLKDLKSSAESDLQLFIIVGPATLMLIFILSEIIFQGLASRLIDDYDREWWSRTCACLFQIAIAWTLWMTISFCGASLIDKLISDRLELLKVGISIVAGAGGAIARTAFVRNAKSKRTSPDQQSLVERYLDMILNLIGLVFIIMLLAVLSYAVEHALQYINSTGDFRFINVNHAHSMSYDVNDAALLVTCLTAIALLFSVTININRFSLHAMYRNRLIRAFLGVSRANHKTPPEESLKDDEEALQFKPRKPNRFTDFDPDDNPFMWWLDPERDLSKLRNPNDPSLLRFPLHIVNCALNRVGDKNPDAKERKASSFTFSSLHAGSEHTKYRRARDYCGNSGGITLGTALAISGAAVSPNAGQYSTPILTFILTLFNARLGWWLGNPRNDSTMCRTSPGLAMKFIIAELLGRTSADKKWLYLSDGGHFDNLGLYEMVRRGCHYIVVVDASADPDWNYDDLGGAIEKIRVDFNVSIERMNEWQIGTPDLGPAGRYCTLFNIGYKKGLGTQDDGKLLYIKPSYYLHPKNMVPMDVMRYAGRNPDFPHESTVDQFFGETKFESYRALGQHEIETMLAAQPGPIDIPDLFTISADYSRP